MLANLYEKNRKTYVKQFKTCKTYKKNVKHNVYHVSGPSLRTFTKIIT